MKVHIPTPLFSYTGNRPVVEVAGASLDEVTRALDREFPGLRFRIIDEQDRIRPHMRLFVNSDEACALSAEVREGDTVHIVCALSGG